MTNAAEALVIEVFYANKQSFFKVARSVPGVSPGLTPFEARAAESPYKELRDRPVQPGQVQKCGDHLCTSLAVNDGVQTILNIFQNPVLDKRYPIYVSIAEPEHEKLPWEAIWRTKFDFLALRPHWPIARLTSATDDIEPRVKKIGLRAKIMAIIAAKDADEETEWNGFEKLLTQYPDKFDIYVLLASEKLADHVRKLRESNPRIEWSFVGSSAEVMQQLRTYRPNIVHFFCHGTSENGGVLSVLQRLGDTIEISTLDLLPLGSLETVCLVVLNCCLGGNSDPDDQSGSIARELVKAGLPAVVAMREIVSDKAANAFTAGFYGELLSKFLEAMASQPMDGSISVPDETWFEALFQGRQALKNAVIGSVPGDVIDWTLPLIYLRRGGLRLDMHMDSVSSVKGGEEVLLRSVRERLAAQPQMPAELLKEIDDRLAALQA
jgi:hypothetical protein